MNFRVIPADIASYGKMIERAHRDVSEARSFLDRKATVDGEAESQLWQLVVGHHSDVLEKAKASIEGFSQTLDACQKELARTATYYTQTDETEAVKVDGTYPAGSGRPAGTPSESGGFSDASEPTASFSEPKLSVWEQVQQGASDRMDGLVWDRVDSVTGEGKNVPLGVLGIGLDLLSPTTLVNEALKFVFNFDIFGEAAKMLAGDWESFGDCAGAWDSLGSFFYGVGSNVRKGNNLLSDTWVGNASNTRYDYFDGLATKLDETDDCYDTLKSAYEEVASQIQQFADGLKAGLILICDMGISIAVEIAVATGAATTGVGLVLTGGMAALIARTAAKMIGEWSKIIDALSALYAAVNVAFGLAGAAMNGNLDAVQKFPRPGAAYDHQAV
ncbi:hypothetical protein IM697_34650 [Streptomyces ferrugineus]|uniref:WXG100 family type VII secretion target n=1 Tax=Streptomyces ferrugineus TaxID=1413221 RepID=A0A7M2SI97_9ACTN|nr:hypothetical protein [Streptomyces ferrugineus]QOV35173.1 hypothetical protein IM697_34650 [Streptomyces ferrugineus]